MTIAMIAAIGMDGEMGFNGQLPWGHIPEDMEHFVTLTSGQAILMGRKTHQSIGRLLPNRQNYVATRKSAILPGAIPVTDLETFLVSWRDSDELLWVIGGAELYTYAESFAQYMEITRLPSNFQADTYFPTMHWSWWECKQQYSKPSKSNQAITSITFESWEKVAGWRAALYNYSAARSSAQYQEMAKLERSRQCLFCTADRELQKILESTHWFVIANQFPYTHTQLHLLVIPKKHYLSLSEMPVAVTQDYLLTIAQLEEVLGLAAYSHFMRVGTMTKTGASIAHLHGHIIVGDNTLPNFEPIRVKLAT